MASEKHDQAFCNGLVDGLVYAAQHDLTDAAVRAIERLDEATDALEDGDEVVENHADLLASSICAICKRGDAKLLKAWLAHPDVFPFRALFDGFRHGCEGNRPAIVSTFLATSLPWHVYAGAGKERRPIAVSSALRFFFVSGALRIAEDNGMDELAAALRQ